MYNIGMNLLLLTGVAYLAVNVYKAAKSFSEKYEILIADKNDVIKENSDGPRDIISLRPENYDKSMDLRGTPTHECVCGCNIWNVKVVFQNFEIGTYFLDMECANCGSLATAPTPVDRTEM